MVSRFRLRHVWVDSLGSVREIFWLTECKSNQGEKSKFKFVRVSNNQGAGVIGFSIYHGSLRCKYLSTCTQVLPRYASHVDDWS